MYDLRYCMLQQLTLTSVSMKQTVRSTSRNC